MHDFVIGEAEAKAPELPSRLFERRSERASIRQLAGTCRAVPKGKRRLVGRKWQCVADNADDSSCQTAVEDDSPFINIAATQLPRYGKFFVVRFATRCACDGRNRRISRNNHHFSPRRARPIRLCVYLLTKPAKPGKSVKVYRTFHFSCTYMCQNDGRFI